MTNSEWSVPLCGHHDLQLGEKVIYPKFPSFVREYVLFFFFFVNRSNNGYNACSIADHFDFDAQGIAHGVNDMKYF
jgi:hypothetical protein